MMRTKEDIEVPTKTVMMKVTALVASLAVIVLGLAGCSAKTMESIAIYTGGVAGTYYPLGQALAEIINSELEGVEASAVVSGGSVANARAIATNEAGLALISNDIADYAYNGTEMFAGSAVESIRGIASWYPEIVQFVTLKATGIESISELHGMTVGVGAPGSGTAVEAMAILSMAGINDQNTTILELDFQAVVSGLKNGTIDAGCIVAGIPTSAVVDLSGSGEVNILEIPDHIFDALKEQYPFFVRHSILSLPQTLVWDAFGINLYYLQSSLSTYALPMTVQQL